MEKSGVAWKSPLRDGGPQIAATDPEVAKQNPPVIRAPNGGIADDHDFWSAGTTYYDPAKITVPTLLVDAEWDHDAPPYMTQTLFPLLVNSPDKRSVELPEGTHTIRWKRTGSSCLTRFRRSSTRQAADPPTRLPGG